MKGRVSSSICAAGLLTLCTVAFAQKAGSLKSRSQVPALLPAGRSQ